MKGPAGDQRLCLVVSFPSGMRAFIPADNADSSLRPLSSKEEALADLEILRSTGVEPDDRIHRTRQDERAKTMRSGSRVEITQLLRRLYAAKAPVSGADGVAIRALEDLVLEEISLVLGIPRAELENEMRDRYPVFPVKKRAH